MIFILKFSIVVIKLIPLKMLRFDCKCVYRVIADVKLPNNRP
jgi:hypothetical protein